MPLFGSKPKPLSIELPSGETIERSVRATMLEKSRALKGTLHMTNRRLMFEADQGDARWLTVPYTEMTSCALYAWPGAAMGLPSSRSQCLVAETVQGEQVWWDFGAKEERAWLPLVQAHVTEHAARAEAEASDAD
jgi:hypothetical protein